MTSLFLPFVLCISSVSIAEGLFPYSWKHEEVIPIESTDSGVLVHMKKFLPSLNSNEAWTHLSDPSEPYRSKFTEWWNSKTNEVVPTAELPSLPPPSQPPSQPPSESSPVAPARVVKDVRSDPRLVPPVIYDMECVPGVGFHLCIQDCTSKSSGSNSERGGTFQETETFKQCVQNCTDALLNAPGPGCLTEEGELIGRDPSGSVKVYSPNTIKMKAALYRIQHAFSIPIGRWMSSIIYHLFTSIVCAVILLVFAKYRIHELLFIQMNGLPSDSRASCSDERKRWNTAHGYHVSMCDFLRQAEAKWTIASGYGARFLTQVVAYVASLMSIFGGFESMGDANLYSSVNGSIGVPEESMLRKLKEYETTFL